MNERKEEQMRMITDNKVLSGECSDEGWFCLECGVWGNTLMYMVNHKKEKHGEDFCVLDGRLYTCKAAAELLTKIKQAQGQEQKP